jgi:hypothetical protein
MSCEDSLEQFSACWEGLEDSRGGNAGPHNLAVLRHMVLNAMKKEGSQGSLRGKFKRAGWDDAFLLRLLELF